VISGRECLSSCPESTYMTETGTCFKCDKSCRNCTGAMASMCQECSPGYYLTGSTCDSSCQNPLFPDPATKSCKNCPYYCDACTQATNCIKCKTGYQPILLNCTGENFMRLSSTYNISVPLNPYLANDTIFNPTEMTIEIWFKADNILSLNMEIILGMLPYKFRKKAGIA